jgi:2,3-diketo-5-methylthio-1-phosphopentane phosphatase
MALRLFIDFDGTITREDVGNLMFREFGGPACDELVRDYREERISAVECFRREAAAMGPVRPTDVDRLVRSREIDEGFPALATFCREENIGLSIVSDGLDFYITTILEQHGIDGLPVFANQAKFHPAGSGLATLALSFPYQDAECTRCACCKRNIILTGSGDEDVIGYIGEGYSDMCPARYADIVFAKSSLQTFCQKENISYYSYVTLHDVVERLRGLMSTGRKIRKRRRAELRRRDAFLKE